MINRIMLTKEELYHLQDLAALNIESEQEVMFLLKLKCMVTYCDLLIEIDTDNISDLASWSDINSQEMLDKVNDCNNAKKLLSNVDHEVINNCIVIKSVLS